MTLFCRATRVSGYTSAASVPYRLEASCSCSDHLVCQELLVILVIVVVIFGASKLPQLGKGLGEGISNFRDGLSKGKDDKALPKSSTTRLSK